MADDLFDETPEIVLQCQGLHRYLGVDENRVHVLNDVSLTLYEQRVYSVMGPSGCGKSTLLYLLGRSSLRKHACPCQRHEHDTEAEGERGRLPKMPHTDMLHRRAGGGMPAVVRFTPLKLPCPGPQRWPEVEPRTL